MKYLLDTNIVSELTKPVPDNNCLAWLEKNSGECAISSITLAELGYGVERLPAGKHKNQRRAEFNFLQEEYSGQFFDFDGAAAVEWGRYAAELEAGYGADWWKTYDFRD